MATIPQYNGQQVRSQGIGSNGFSMRAPDASGLGQGLARAENAMLERMQQERENADTAALLDADRKLNDWKSSTLFDPEKGVYARKGQNALDVTNQTLPEYDKQVEQIMGGLTSEQQKARFKIVADRQRESLNGELNRYEYGERQAWYDASDDASLKGAIGDAALYYNDPNKVTGYLNKGLSVIEAQGRRKGLPAEAVDQSKASFTSGMHTTVISRMLDTDPMQAMSYFAGNRGSMTADDLVKVSKVIEPMVQRQVGTDIANSLLSGGDADYQRYLPAQFQQESGGRQFGEDGKPLTSPAGAVGVAQVMEATGPEAAKLAGLQWDRERWLHDREYNAALGAAYSREQFATFKDPVLALAAYNAGPGRVQETLQKVGDPRTGAVTHEQFLAAMPKETQGYVVSIMEKSPRSMAAEGSDRYATALTAVQRLPAGKAREAAEEQIKAFKAANDAQQRAVYEEAADQIKQGGFNNLPQQYLSQLSAEDLGKLKALDKSLREGVEPVTDMAKFEGFLRMPPSKLVELSLERDIRPYLSNADFKTVRGAWQKAQEGDDSFLSVARAEHQMLKDSMIAAGIDVGDTTESRTPENLKSRQKFIAAYQGLKFAFRKKLADEGKPVRDPSLEEARTMTELMVLDARLGGTGWFGSEFSADSRKLWEVAPEQLTDAYISKGDFTIDQIPPLKRQQIIAARRAKSLPSSEELIIADYLNEVSSIGGSVR